MNSDPLLQDVTQLFDLLAERNVDFVLVGGVALLSYVEGRNTEDIDLIMASASLDSLSEIKVVDRKRDFARGSFGDLQIDVLLTTNPLFETVRRSYATTKDFRERSIPCATVEGLLLLKLYALPSLYRQGNFARVGLYENDIATLMQAYRPDTDSLFRILGRHLSETDLSSLRDIVAEIGQRIERFRNKANGQ
ncbi:MAG: hypothetical protein AB1696_25940 [Planctomycetota bacterium]